MDARLFDALVQGFSASASRRRVAALLAALPVVGGLPGFLDPDDVAARRRGRRRKAQHQHGKGRHRRKKHKKHKKTKPCRGSSCGVTCGSAFCKLATEVCDNGSCVPCDVCAECAHQTVQGAVDAASNGDTIILCAGAYTRSGLLPVVMIPAKTLTVRGAGVDHTILDGANVASSLPVVTIEGTVQLHDLTVTGSNGYSGIVTFAPSNVTLQNVSVTGNHQASNNRGGGIFNQSTLTLKDGTAISANTAGDGAGIFNSPTGVLTLQAGSRVTANTASNVGGGVFNFGGGQVVRDGGVISDNDPDDCVNQDNTAC